jgi:hypothetical protein
VVIAVSCFLPWAKVQLFGTISVSGTDSGGDGWIFLGGAVALAALAWWRPPRWAALLLSLAGVIGFIYERHDIGTSKTISVSLGVGLWLILLASLVAAGTAIHALTEGTEPAPIAQRLPPALQRYWWGLGLAFVLLAGTIAYGQEHHDESLGFSDDTSGDSSLSPGDFGDDHHDATDCAGKGKTSLTADINELDSFSEGSGPVTVELLQTRELPRSFHDNFVDETVTADGKFVGIQVEVTNDSSVETQPSSLYDNWRLTDGNASWETADYNGSHDTGVSGAYADSQGDDQPETQIAAGFDGTTWAVFDIPADADPSAISIANDSDQTCLALP